MFIHKRKAGQNNGQGYQRKNDTYGAGLEVANCHESIIRRCMEITGKGSICYADKESRMKNRNQRLYRWNLRSNECRNVIQEVYPYLVGKQHEARLVLGCPSSGPDAEKAHANLIKLHNGFPADIDFPAPESLFQSGFYLRQDIIWSKLNPMPESVTDRCTKAHEYIFLMSKSAKYYCDMEAIKELAAVTSLERWNRPNIDNEEGSVRANGGTRPDRPMKAVGGPRSHKGSKFHTGKTAEHQLGRASASPRVTGNLPGRDDQGRACNGPGQERRNKRSVWTISTKPFSEAHFATFPEELPKLCILAGTKPGGIVLDPFGGSGTTGRVAEDLGRDWILIDINPQYKLIADRRTAQTGIKLQG